MIIASRNSLKGCFDIEIPRKTRSFIKMKDGKRFLRRIPVSLLFTAFSFILHFSQMYKIDKKTFLFFKSKTVPFWRYENIFS